MNSTITRRNLLAQVATTAGLGWVVLSAACKGAPAELSCTSTAGLTPDEINQRNILKYVDKTTDAAKPCSTCAQYKAGAADACGTCVVIKGPINPKGSCSVWAPKPA